MAENATRYLGYSQQLLQPVDGSFLVDASIKTVN
jgi:hypothetical protein